jgi:hypothetical protein
VPVRSRNNFDAFVLKQFADCLARDVIVVNDEDAFACRSQVSHGSI